MAWTAPRTWVASENTTAVLFNAHLRDNPDFIKDVMNDVGKFLGITSAYLEDLDGTNVAGLIQPTDDNDHEGVNNFNNSGGRVVIPVGADKYTGTIGVDAKGVWIEGDYFHHIDETFIEWRMLGTFVSTPGGGAIPGSVWFDTSTNRLHYIDADGDERKYDFNTSNVHDDSGIEGGSTWVEDDHLHWIYNNRYDYRMHQDVSHTDHDDHTDGSSHNDYTDYSDYSDHLDGGSGHADSYGDHTDYSHYDVYVDHTDHTDHDDHTDTGSGHTDSSSHNDHTDHDDIAADSRPVLV